MIPYLFTADAITLFLPDCKSFSIRKDHKYFNALVKEIKDKNEAGILSVVDMATRLQNFTAGKVVVLNGEVYYGEEHLHGAIVDRILQGITLGLEPDSYIKFLENLMLNPSFQSRKELYGFLEACDLPITEDGRFIAYKSVKSNFMDAHSGTYENKPGAIISMPRSKVDDDCNVACSYGLHVCSRAYGKFSEILMLVAVNPKDVVSVPTDYSFSKMRVCEYEVLKQIEDFQSFDETPVYEEDDIEEEDDVMEDECPACGSLDQNGDFCSNCGLKLT